MIQLTANFWRLPLISSDFLEDIAEWMPTYGTLSGLSISEYDNKTAGSIYFKKFNKKGTLSLRYKVDK